MMDRGPLEVLLALCARPETTDPDNLRSLLLSEISWTEVFTEALWHKVAFLAYDRMATTGLLDAALTTGNLPLLLLNHWKQLYRVNIQRNRLLLEQAQVISACLSWHGAEHAVGKGGPLLIGRVYEPGQRKMYDIDFLARRDQLVTVQKAFADLGYQHGSYDHSTGTITPLASEDVRKWLLHARGLPNFLLKVDDDIVDVLVAQVQFKVGSTTDGSAVASTQLLERASARDGMRVLDDVDLMLQLVLHVARETRDGEFAEWNMDWNLIKLCDLDRFLHGIADDALCDAFAERAGQLGFLEHSAYTFLVLADVFPSPVVDGLVARLLAVRPGLEQLVEQVQQMDVRARIAGMTSGRAQVSGWTQLIGSKTS